MPIVLSIETSTSICSVAFHKEGRLLASREIETHQSAASQLAISIESLMSECNIENKEIVAVAVSSGPGSFTGLRIGISTAKGICYGLDVPLIAVDSLSVLAHGIEKIETQLLCPMIDARRMEVYCSIMDSEFKIIQKSKAQVVNENTFLSWLNKYTVSFFGDGSSKCKEVIHHPNAVFIEQIMPLAKNMGTLAYNKLCGNKFENLANFEPNYIKAVLASTKLKLKT